MSALRGWPRSDGRKGIRNVVAVAYLVECAHHVAREIAGVDREADILPWGAAADARRVSPVEASAAGMHLGA